MPFFACSMTHWRCLEHIGCVRKIDIERKEKRERSERAKGRGTEWKVGGDGYGQSCLPNQVDNGPATFYESSVHACYVTIDWVTPSRSTLLCLLPSAFNLEISLGLLHLPRCLASRLEEEGRRTLPASWALAGLEKLLSKL